MTKKPESQREKAAVTEPPVTSVLAAKAAPTGILPDTAHRRKTKAALLREMLEAPTGASVPSIMVATGWQSHTVRAALSGLRKTGCVLDRSTGPDGAIYVIASAGQSAPAASIGRDECGRNTGVVQAPMDGAATKTGEEVLPPDEGRQSRRDGKAVASADTTDTESRS